MIPIVYRFDDGNAPVHVGTAGSLVNLLEKCLVTGYGDKLPAGWTKDYANVENTIAAFRNNPATGTGFFLSCYRYRRHYRHGTGIRVDDGNRCRRGTISCVWVIVFQSASCNACEMDADRHGHCVLPVHVSWLHNHDRIELFHNGERDRQLTPAIIDVWRFHP